MAKATVMICIEKFGIMCNQRQITLFIVKIVKTVYLKRDISCSIN